MSFVCPCQSFEQCLILFNQATIPRRYAAVTLKNYDEFTPSQGDAKITLRNLLKNFQPGMQGIGLSGTVGTGKTHLMVALVRELTLKLKIKTKFIEFSHLLSELRAGYSEGKSDNEILSFLVKVPVLVIDELGKGLETQWQKSILDELISKRYNLSVSTFFTTNFSFRLTHSNQQNSMYKFISLKDRIGSRMSSRLDEMCLQIEIIGPDYRELKIKNKL